MGMMHKKSRTTGKIGDFLRGSSSQGKVAQLLAGTDAGTGVRGHAGVRGAILLFSPTMWAG